MENLDKLKEAILYITSNVSNYESLGSIKLNKIIWASDVEMFIKTGKSITGATYTKQNFGPVPKHIPTARKELVDEKRTVEKTKITVQGNEQLVIIPLIDYDESKSIFEKQEIAILSKKTLDVSMNHTAMSISEDSHDIIWESATIGETIPLFAYLAGQTKDIEDDDIEWGKNILSKYGYTI